MVRVFSFFFTLDCTTFAHIIFGYETAEPMTHNVIFGLRAAAEVNIIRDYLFLFSRDPFGYGWMGKTV